MTPGHKEIVDAINAGEKRADVARRLKIDVGHVSRVAKLYIGAVWSKGNTVDYDRMRELYDAGCNDPDIAEQMDCAVSTVRWWRRFERLPAMRPVGSAGDQQLRAVQLVVKDGMTYAQAGAIVGLSRNAVAGAVHRRKKRQLEAVGQ